MTNEQNDKPAPEPEQGQTQLEPKVIKRYSNRKLYDTERSKYVTLDEIAKMIKAGEEVTIIDNETKEDLTSVTLTQIIYEEEKRESRMPLAMLRKQRRVNFAFAALLFAMAITGVGCGSAMNASSTDANGNTSAAKTPATPKATAQSISVPITINGTTVIVPNLTLTVQ